MSASHGSDPRTWVEQYGDLLYRYALARLRNPTLAEEAVQEAFVAALQARARFSGRSSERTWLVGILKHKIIDQFRRTSRERPLEVDDVGEPDASFDAGGAWRQDTPVDWGDGRAALIQKEFQEVLGRCLSGLPRRMADAIALRELEALSAADVCKVLNVSATNLWVLLHRARAQLRRCLQRNWGGSRT